MSANLADAFGRGTRPGAGSSKRGAAAPRPRPSRSTSDESLVAAGIWLPVGLHERLNVFCRTAGVSQAEAILRAVDYAADHVDELAAKPEPAPEVELTGGLFPRPISSPPQKTGRALSIRFRSDHLTTLTRLAGEHGLKRSVLVKLCLADYLDSTEVAQ